MSRDYAKKGDRNPQKKGSRATKTSSKGPKAASKPANRSVGRSGARAQQGGLSLKWILSLATVGGFIGFIVYLNSLPSPVPSNVPASTSPDTSKSAGQQEKADGEPRFKFYDMLPDSEVVPPQIDAYKPGPGQTSFDYMVQTGSFRTREDAERQRAQIAFQGLRAYVTRIDLEGNSTWYRVNVGPFTSRSQMNSAVDKLVAISIEPLVRKIPKTQKESSEAN